MKNTILPVILGVMVASSVVFADQDTYDLRSEQHLRLQAFDVKHYRIALTLDAETQSFCGDTYR